MFVNTLPKVLLLMMSSSCTLAVPSPLDESKSPACTVTSLFILTTWVPTAVTYISLTVSSSLSQVTNKPYTNLDASVSETFAFVCLMSSSLTKVPVKSVPSIVTVWLSPTFLPSGSKPT